MPKGRPAPSCCFVRVKAMHELFRGYASNESCADGAEVVFLEFFDELTGFRAVSFEVGKEIPSETTASTEWRDCRVWRRRRESGRERKEG